jgi:hypothetical protein
MKLPPILLLALLSFLFGLSAESQGQAIPVSPPSSETNALGPEKERGMGSEESKRPDGGKDKVYYSVTTPEEEKETRKEEKEKQDKSLGILNNIIIDQRSKPRKP